MIVWNVHKRVIFRCNSCITFNHNEKKVLKNSLFRKKRIYDGTPCDWTLSGLHEMMQLRILNVSCNMRNEGIKLQLRHPIVFHWLAHSVGKLLRRLPNLLTFLWCHKLSHCIFNSCCHYKLLSISPIPYEETHSEHLCHQHSIPWLVRVHRPRGYRNPHGYGLHARVPPAMTNEPSRRTMA